MPQEPGASGGGGVEEPPAAHGGGPPHVWEDRGAQQGPEEALPTLPGPHALCGQGGQDRWGLLKTK